MRKRRECEDHEAEKTANNTHHISMEPSSDIDQIKKVLNGSVTDTVSTCSSSGDFNLLTLSSFDTDDEEITLQVRRELPEERPNTLNGDSGIMVDVCGLDYKDRSSIIRGSPSSPPQQSSPPSYPPHSPRSRRTTKTVRQRLHNVSRSLSENQLFFVLLAFGSFSVMLSTRIILFRSFDLYATADYIISSPNTIYSTKQEYYFAGNDQMGETKSSSAILPLALHHASRDDFTIRIQQRSNRIDLIQSSLDSFSMCDNVRHIQIDWKMQEAAPPQSIANHASGKAVVVRSGAQDTSESFPSVDTDAIFLVDDDLVFSCEDLSRAFHVWKENPERMVGFYAYRHVGVANYTSPHWWFSQPSSSSYKDNPKWSLEEVPKATGPYSVLSDRAAFVHKEYIKNTFSAGICQRIALSVKVSSIAVKPPILVTANPVELRSSQTMSRWNQLVDKEIVKNSAACFSALMHMYRMHDLSYEEYTFTGWP